MIKQLFKTVVTVLLIAALGVAVLAASAPAIDKEKAYFEIGTQTTLPGSPVSIPITIGNNPGFWGFSVTLGFDDTVLTLDENEAVTLGDDFIGSATAVSYCSDNTLIIEIENESLLDNIYTNGVVAYINFTVSVGAPTGFYAVSFTGYDASDVTDFEFNDVAFTYGNGGVEVSDSTDFTEQSTTAPTTTEPPTTDVGVLLGDCNGDGKVNTRDVLTLRKHLAGLDCDIVLQNADCNGDSKVNTRDVLTLRKYLAGLITL